MIFGELGYGHFKSNAFVAFIYYNGEIFDKQLFKCFIFLVQATQGYFLLIRSRSIIFSRFL